MDVITKRISSVLVASAVAMILVAGCGDKKDDKKVATQVAAKVDAEEISVHQINAVLSKAAGIPQERVQDAKKEILNRLVDQQLAVNKAIEEKLDRSPEIMMAIEGARKEILARAHLEKLAGTLAKPTPEDIKKYYAEHPQLFAQRRIYNLQELAVQKSDGLLQPLQEKVQGAKSMEDVVSWLKGRNVKVAASGGPKAAEQIPLELLPRIHEMRDGQAIVLETPQAILVMKVLASQAAPVDEATAAPRITQFLANQRATAAIADEMKQLRAKAKIEYVGEFAAMSDKGPEKSAPAKAAPANPNPGAGAANLDKGIGGLK